MVFDECHHAAEKHPYRVVARHLYDHPGSVKPRILGLTASIINIRVEDILSLEENIRELERCLDCVVATSFDKSLEEYSNRPDPEIVQYSVNREAKVDDLFDWLSDWSIARAFDFFIAWAVDWLLVRGVDWLIDSTFINWLIAHLMNWLVFDCFLAWTSQISCLHYPSRLQAAPMTESLQEVEYVLSDVSGWLEAAKNAKLPLKNTPENLHDRLTDEDKNAKEGLREIRNEVEKVRKCLTALGPYCAYLVSFHASIDHPSQVHIRNAVWIFHHYFFNQYLFWTSFCFFFKLVPLWVISMYTAFMYIFNILFSKLWLGFVYILFSWKFVYISFWV